MEWQRTKDPQLFAEMVVRYQPIVNSVVNKYRTWGVSAPTLRAKANTQMIKALQTFKDTGGAAPSTHIWNNLQKVQRLAGASLQSGHIPEARNLKRVTFKTVMENLTDQLGHEPSAQQMADELGWDVREVGRMNSELGGETTASNAEFDFYGNSATSENRDMALADYLYHELDDKDKVIFEHAFGYAGKPKLNNKQIAANLGTNEMAITRAKRRMADKIRSYR
jgi:DNA-directed RNA polymerase specialized sigma subunit